MAKIPTHEALEHGGDAETSKRQAHTLKGTA